MNLIEISERKVISSAKALLARFRANPYASTRDRAYRAAETQLLEDVTLLEERERVAAGMTTEYVADVAAEPMPDDLPMPPGGFMPEGPIDVPPRPGAEPITRPPRKLSRREQEIEKRRASDVTARGRRSTCPKRRRFPATRLTGARKSGRGFTSGR